MSRRANPKIVGGFVLAAIALLVGGALVFGSFSFFEVTRTAVVFFEGSVDLSLIHISEPTRRS